MNLSLGCIGKKVLLKENKDQIIAHKITQNCLNKDPILILLPLMKEVKIEIEKPTFRAYLKMIGKEMYMKREQEMCMM